MFSSECESAFIGKAVYTKFSPKFRGNTSENVSGVPGATIRHFDAEEPAREYYQACLEAGSVSQVTIETRILTVE